MTTIKTITIEYGYTFNLGNYSNVRPIVTLTAELADGDVPDIVIQTLQDKARREVENQIDFVLRQANKAPHFEQLRAGAVGDSDMPF
jgi:hypothetical protein